MTEKPLISIITATYNRSNVLYYAIKSVINSTYSNWELIIVGDSCTDDTVDIVNSFSDSRIKFINLEKNFGEQSGPNNVGCSMARGEYIAYLNHDDLYFPDHLELSMNYIKSTNSDMVFSLQYRPEIEQIRLLCVCDSEHYTPPLNIPASCWLLKKELYEEIGGWTSAKKIYNSPSQDWIFRAWKLGKKISMLPNIGVIAIASGCRKDSYKNRDYIDNEYYFNKMNSEPFLRKQFLTDGLIDYVKFYKGFSFLEHIFIGFKRLIGKLFIKLGIHPYSIFNFIMYGKKGNFIKHLRKVRGL